MMVPSVERTPSTVEKICVPGLARILIAVYVAAHVFFLVRGVIAPIWERHKLGVRLNPSGREVQRFEQVFAALRRAQAALAAGERAGAALEQEMRAELGAAPGLAIDYAAVVDAATLEPLVRVDRAGRALLAARLGAVRLIDNGPLLPSKS